MTDADRKLLVEAVNGCFHENGGWSAIDIDKSGAGDLSIASYRCVKCGRSYQQRDNPTFTDSAELWDLLMYMVGREDWRRFYTDMWDKYTVEQREWSVYGYIPWLTDPARFVKLASEWCREHKEVKP